MEPDATSHPVAAAFVDGATAASLAGVRTFGARRATGRRDWQTQFVLGQGGGERLLPNDVDVEATPAPSSASTPGRAS